LSVRTTLLTLVLVLAACGRSDRQDAPTTHDASLRSAPRGPDNLVLRIPRTGGSARVYAYPRLDTVVWSAGGVPAPARILGFDDEAGTIAYVDAKGQPARLDFRQGAGYTVSKAKSTGLSTPDGNAIFAIVGDGSVERYARGGTWKWKPPVPARALFPQGDGTLLVLGERTGGSVMWRVRPPVAAIADSALLPKVDRTLRTQVGDRLYLASGAQLTGLRTRTMERTPDVAFDGPVELLAATPSGDRVFVVTKVGTAIEIVDRYQERVSGRIDIGRNVAELRVDPLGRYLLARPEGVDSAIVIALGTNRIIGSLATTWRADLPFVAPDGGVALAQGADVIIADGATLKPTTRVKNGAADFWYAFQWTGFRPRAAALDQPVEFAGPPVDSAARADSLARADSANAAPAGDTVAARRAPGAFTVSFAALLVADKARDLAAQIHVGNESARVVTSVRDGATIYRVVMGPYATKEDAERVGRESRQSYWVYEGGP
jgi:hypothetical protein